MPRWQFSHLLLLFISTSLCLGGEKSGNTSMIKDENGWWTIKTTGGEHGNDFEDKSYINQDYQDDDEDYEEFYDVKEGDIIKSFLNAMTNSFET